MKTIKILLIICIITGLGYIWFTRDTPTKNTPCGDCEVLKKQHNDHLVGTLEFTTKGLPIFTDQLTNLEYNLIACDSKCESQQLTNFVKNSSKERNILFSVEGMYNQKSKAFICSFINLLGKRNFVIPNQVKGLSFNEIREKNIPIEEEDFLLNQSHYAGLRAFLPHYYNNNQLGQPIPLKETTWETSDSTLVSIWYEQKNIPQKKWIPIEFYEWNKGTDF